MFPELETRRFLLKQIVSEDKAFIFRGLSDPQVTSFYGVKLSNFKETGTQMKFYDQLWKNKTGCWWKITDRKVLLPIGACGMNNYNKMHEKAEIGYWLLPEFWKKGILQEVLPVMINHLFSNWKLHRLEAMIEEGNDASRKVAERIGFGYEGKMKESEIKDGKRISLYLYSLLATDNR